MAGYVLSERLRADSRPIVVTGAGGWLGSAALNWLDFALNGEISSRVAAFGSASREQLLRSGRSISVKPLHEIETINAPNALVLHFAYLTKDRVADLGVDKFVRTNELISDTVERFVRTSRASAIFVPSSGAVYDVPQQPYGELKLRDEERFANLAAEGVCRSTLCRIFNLSGPFLNKVGNYALGSIVRDIGKGGPIVLRAAHPVLRSYVHVRTIIELAVAALLDSPSVIGPFDTAGAEIIEIGELARLACNVLGRPNITIERPIIPTNARADRYVGDGTMMINLLERYAVESVPLETQILETAAYLGVF